MSIAIVFRDGIGDLKDQGQSPLKGSEEAMEDEIKEELGIKKNIIMLILILILY
jgi:hypothetical protein